MVGRAARARAPFSKLFVAIHILVVLAPIAVIAVWACADRWPWPDLLPQSFSLRGIEQVLFSKNGEGIAVMGGSIGIAAATAVLATAVAAMAARAICAYRWVGRNAFSFLLVVPFLIPSTVFAMGVQVLFIRAGIARTVAGVVLAHAIVALPYAVTIMLDVTRAVGTRLEDAARTLGAGPVRTFFAVTLPALMPGILSAMSMSYILSFSQYFLTLLIGGGSVRTFATVMFPYLSGGDRTIAGAYGILFILATFVVFLIFEWLLKRFGMRDRAALYG